MTVKQRLFRAAFAAGVWAAALGASAVAGADPYVPPVPPVPIPYLP